MNIKYWIFYCMYQWTVHYRDGQVHMQEGMEEGRANTAEGISNQGVPFCPSVQVQV